MAQVQIEVPVAAEGGVFVSKAYLNGGASPVIATGSDADRWVSISECVAALGATEQGDLRLETITIRPPMDRGPAPLFAEEDE